MSTLITKLFRKNRIITISPLVSDCTIGRNFSFSYTIQYNSIQYNIVYFQHRTQLHHNSNFLPNIGMVGKGVDRRIILSWSTPIWLKSCRNMHPLPIHVSAKFHLDIFHSKQDMVIGIFHIWINNFLAYQRFFD